MQLRRGLVVLFTMAAVVLGVAGCGEATHSAVPATTVSRAAVVPADQLRTHVKMLSQSIGNRSVRAYTGLTKAADYLDQQFRAAGCSVTRQTFSAGGKQVSNIVATVAGTPTGSGTVVIGGHYDTDNNPGADDNASSVAILLELARQLRGQSLPKRLRLVAFVNEEDPWNDTSQQGALVYAKSLKAAREDLRAMLNLDMCGWFSSRYRYALVGANSASESLAQKVVGLFPKGTSLPTRRLSSRDPDLAWCDNGAFWKQGYAAVLVSSPGYQYDPNYHSAADTWEKLNYNDMAELVKGLAACAKSL